MIQSGLLGDKFVFYSARDHFLLPQNEIPCSITDKFELNLTISHENLICDIDRNGVDPPLDYFELSNIDFNIYYFQLSEPQRQAFIDMRNSSGIAFAYRVFGTR
jgi:hypothetical protein